MSLVPSDRGQSARTTKPPPVIEGIPRAPSGGLTCLVSTRREFCVAGSSRLVTTEGPPTSHHFSWHSFNRHVYRSSL